MRKFENVTLLVDEAQGEMRIIMAKKEEGCEILDNEYLCTLELNSEEEK